MYFIQKSSQFDKAIFHVITSDREMLNTLTRLLNSRGFIGCWEKSGEMRFILDGRKGAYSVLQQLEEVQNKLQEFEMEYDRPQRMDLQLLIQNVLNRYRVPRELKGREYLAELLFYLTQPGSVASNFSKGAYQHLARHFQTDVRSVDRSIRYARAKAGYRESNRQFTLRLLQEVLEQEWGAFQKQTDDLPCEPERVNAKM